MINKLKQARELLKEALKESVNTTEEKLAYSHIEVADYWINQAIEELRREGNE